jgi:RNA polymerase sigma factor (sigma-70 family)
MVSGTSGVVLSDPQRALVQQHLWLVDLHLRKKVPGLDKPLAGRSRDDLYQEGCLGLIEAVRRYDPDQGIPFVAFALPRIHTAVSRALWRGSSLVRMPRRVHLCRGREAREAIAQVVPLEREPPGRPESQEPDNTSSPPVETLGRRLRRKIERAVRSAVEQESRVKSRRGDRQRLLEELAEHRLLVPHEDQRTPLREIARRTGSSIARVVQCDQRLRERVEQALAGDLEIQRLRWEARSHPLGMNAPLDTALQMELRELTERRFLDAFKCAAPPQRSRLLTRLMECCGRTVTEFVSVLYASLPREQQEVLLSESRAPTS